MRCTAVIAAVVVAFGAACGSDDGGAATSTTDAPDAAEAEQVVAATATFTGSACDYEGPDEFAVGTEVTFTVTTNVETESGFGVVKVTDGTTAEQIREQGVFTYEEFFRAVPTADDLEVGAAYDIPVTLDVAGTWALNCFVMDGPPQGTDHPAVVFEVTP